jgi:hypothetical protein
VYSTIASKREQEIINSAGFKQNEQEFLKDPLTNGVLSVTEFDSVTDTGLTDKQVLQLHALDDNSEAGDNDGNNGANQYGIHADNVADNAELTRLQEELFDAETGSYNQSDDMFERLLVCQRFLRKECTKTTCPFAHPGIRDAAKVAVRSICCSLWCLC